MRTLFHFGIFALALATVSGASADDYGHRTRRTAVVVAPSAHRVPARRVGVYGDPGPYRYQWERSRQMEQQRQAAARRALYEEQRDHDEIVRIRNRWHAAVRHGNPVAQQNAERRATDWIDREIAESRWRHDGSDYVHRLHALRRELRVSHAWPPGRGRGHGRGRGARVYTRKQQIFDELVTLSVYEVQRARADVRRGPSVVVARR